MRTQILMLLIVGFYSTIDAQTRIQGYIFENNNQGYLSEVTVSLSSGDFSDTVITDIDGQFESQIPEEIDSIRIISLHGLFLQKDTTIVIDHQVKTQYIKLAIERKPAYLFDVVLQEKPVSEIVPIEGITGAKFEVYNNTTGKVSLVIDSLTSPNLKFSFEQGNHYTLLIQKSGYKPKRLEAYVNVDDCILCFDGLNMVRRNAHDVLTKSNSMGTIIANIQMIPNTKLTVLELNNIHYDYNKSDIRPDAAYELNKAVSLLKENDVAFVELESHSDSRGTDLYNRHLSQFRAQSAVDYIVQNEGINKGKIFAKGFGESQLVNGCKDGVKCNETQHQANRRTVVKIHIKIPTEIYEQSLQEIILEEKLLESTVGTEVMISSK